MNIKEVEKGGVKIDPVLKKVSAILDLDEAALLISQEKDGFKKTFDDILKKYRSNSEINSLGLELSINDVKNSSDNFYKVDSEFKKNKDLGKVFIEALVREGRSFLEIDPLLNTYYGNDKKIYKLLVSHYKKYIAKVSNFYKDDLTKSLIKTEKDNKELFNVLIANKVISGKGKTIVLDDYFIKKSLLVLNSNSISDNEKDKEKKEKELLASIMGFQINTLNENELFVFNTIYNLIKLEKDSKKSKDSIDNEDNLNENKKNETIKNESDLDFDLGSDSINEKFESCESNIKASYYSGVYYLETPGSAKIFLLESEIDNMTSNAIENYVNFYNTMNDLGLIFLWNKYKSDFITISKNKLGFDYINGEGITEGKILSVLNMIGRNIGTPEYSVLDNEGNETKETRCFKTLGDAKMSFKAIKETGKINGKQYSDNGNFSNGAVENKLIEVLCIDQKTHGLNISQWK